MRGVSRDNQGPGPTQHLEPRLRHTDRTAADPATMLEIDEWTRRTLLGLTPAISVPAATVVVVLGRASALITTMTAILANAHRPGTPPRKRV
jgi:hypothetical protein